MVRRVRIPFLLLTAILAGAAVSCRDIDEPPPLPVFDPDAPLDGGTDAPEDGSMVWTNPQQSSHVWAS